MIGELVNGARTKRFHNEDEGAAAVSALSMQEFVAWLLREFDVHFQHLNQQVSQLTLAVSQQRPLVEEHCLESENMRKFNTH